MRYPLLRPGGDERGMHVRHHSGSASRSRGGVVMHHLQRLVPAAHSCPPHWDVIPLLITVTKLLWIEVIFDDLDVELKASPYLAGMFYGYA